MRRLEKPWADPHWDYNSIWETLENIRNTTTELMSLLLSEAADTGSEKIDGEILRALAQVKGDVIGIEKALNSEETAQISTENKLYQQLELLNGTSRETFLLLQTMNFNLAAINNAMGRFDLNLNSQ